MIKIICFFLLFFLWNGCLVAPTSSPGELECNPPSSLCIAPRCYAVIRLDYLSMKIKGFDVISAHLKKISEKISKRGAKKAANDFSKKHFWPKWGWIIFQSIWKETESLYIFLDMSGDFGGVIIIGKNTGKILFAGEIAWSGGSENPFVYPPLYSEEYPSLYPESKMGGKGCTSMTPAQLIGINEETGIWSTYGPGVIPLQQLKEIWQIVSTTGLVQMLQSQGQLEVSILRYTPGIGSFNSKTAEWIIILSPLLTSSQPIPTAEKDVLDGGVMD